MRAVFAGLGMLGAAIVMAKRMVEIVDEDGDTTWSSLKSFIEVNRETLHDSEVEELIALGVGEEMVFGGGAAPRIAVRRVS